MTNELNIRADCDSYRQKQTQDDPCGDPSHRTGLGIFVRYIAKELLQGKSRFVLTRPRIALIFGPYSGWRTVCTHDMASVVVLDFQFYFTRLKMVWRSGAKLDLDSKLSVMNANRLI
jgi:hypothetical protein